MFQVFHQQQGFYGVKNMITTMSTHFWNNVAILKFGTPPKIFVWLRPCLRAKLHLVDQRLSLYSNIPHQLRNIRRYLIAVLHREKQTFNSTFALLPARDFLTHFELEWAKQTSSALFVELHASGDLATRSRSRDFIGQYHGQLTQKRVLSLKSTLGCQTLRSSSDVASAGGGGLLPFL